MNPLAKFGAKHVLFLCVAVTGCSGKPRSRTNDAFGGGGAAATQGGSESTSGGAGGDEMGGEKGGALGGLGVGGSATGSVGGAELGGASNTEALGGAATGGATSSVPPLHRGQVLLYSIVRDTSARADAVYASFYTATPQQCASQTIGACRLSAGCAPPALAESAGTLSVTSRATDATIANNLTLAPRADNTYAAAALAGAFTGGESTHIASTGATVPAFSVDLKVPLPLLIDSPVPSSSGTISVNAFTDLVIKFSRAAGTVQLYAQTPDGALECFSAPGESTLTIPQAALAGADTLSLFTLDSQTITAGQFTVSAEVIVNALTPGTLRPVFVRTF